MRDLPDCLPRPRFTADDQQHAWDSLGANCGPGALAGMCAITPLQAAHLMGPEFLHRRATNKPERLRPMKSDLPVILESRPEHASANTQEFTRIWESPFEGLGGFLEKYEAPVGLVLRVSCRSGMICPDIQVCFPDHARHPHRIRISDSNDVLSYNRDMAARIGADRPRDLVLPATQAAYLLERRPPRDDALAARALALASASAGRLKVHAGSRILRLAVTRDLMRALPDSQGAPMIHQDLPVSCPKWHTLSAHNRMKGAGAFAAQLRLLDRLDHLTCGPNAAETPAWT